MDRRRFLLVTLLVVAVTPRTTTAWTTPRPPATKKPTAAAAAVSFPKRQFAEFQKQALQVVLATGLLTASSLNPAFAEDLTAPPAAEAKPPPTSVQFNVETKSLAKSIEDSQGQLNSAVATAVKAVPSDKIKVTAPEGKEGDAVRQALAAKPEEKPKAPEAPAKAEAPVAAAAPVVAAATAAKVEAAKPAEPQKVEAAPVAAAKPAEPQKVEAAPAAKPPEPKKVEATAAPATKPPEPKKVEAKKPEPKKEAPKKSAVAKTSSSSPGEWFKKTAFTYKLPAAKGEKDKTEKVTNGQVAVVGALGLGAAIAISANQYDYDEWYEGEEEGWVEDTRREMRANAAAAEERAAVAQAARPAAPWMTGGEANEASYSDYYDGSDSNGSSEAPWMTGGAPPAPTGGRSVEASSGAPWMTGGAPQAIADTWRDPNVADESYEYGEEYEQGYEQGYEQPYDQGYEEGYDEQGYEQGYDQQQYEQPYQQQYEQSGQGYEQPSQGNEQPGQGYDQGYNNPNTVTPNSWMPPSGGDRRAGQADQGRSGRSYLDSL